MEGEQHLEIYGRFREEVGMQTYLHGPMDCAERLTLPFRVGDLDLPQRKKRYTSSREEEEDAQMCPCGEAKERCALAAK